VSIVSAGGQGAAGDARRQVAAGLSTGILAAITSMAHGMLAFAPLGPGAVGVAMAAALVSSVLAGLAMALLAGSRPLVGTTTASTSLLVASLLAAAQPASVAEGMALAMLLSTLAACLVLAVARAGLGRLAGLMPTPVATGLMNSIVLLVLLGQLPLMLGLRPGEALGSAPPQPGALLVSLAALAAMLRPLPWLPPPVMAIAAAAAMQALLPFLGMAPAPVVGMAPSPALLLDSLLAAHRELDAAVAQAGRAALLGPTVLSLALLAVIETLSVAAVVRERTGRRADGSRDLAAGAVAMLGGAAAGGVPGSTLTSSTMALLTWGGQGRIAMVTRAVATLGVLLLAAPLVAALPYAALAGVLAGAAARLFSAGALRPGRGPGRARRLADAAVVLGMMGCALAFGLVVAVGVGVLLSVLIFTATMAASPVRRRRVNPVGRSRVRRPPAAERRLREAGNGLRLLELEGAIFFGSAEAVVTEAEAAFAGGAEVLILDLSRVTRIDQSGGRRLLEACRIAPGRVLLCPLHSGSRPAAELGALDLLGAVPAGAAKATLADAVEAAEEMLLARMGTAERSHALPRESLAALGMPAAAVEALIPQLVEQAFADGARIAARGDPADAAWLLLEGQVAISLPGAPGRPATRLAVLAPGVIFGESALLGGARRTADVTARGPVRCLRLDRAAMEALRRDAPDAAWHLVSAVARQLSAHVAAANATIDNLEG
jgi:SulP family sulfate permease